MTSLPIETDVPRSPGWWLQTLATELHDRRAGRSGRRVFTRQSIESSKIRPGLDLLSDYLRGDPPLREDVHSGWSKPFRQYLRMGRMNIAPLLVSATGNRMGIRDFRTAAGDDELGDRAARDLMRHNDLRLKAREVTDDMLGLGDGYTLVTPPDATRSWSLITSESPMQCITAHDPMTGAEIAGLKMFRDDWDGSDWAYLFLPGELYVARADVPTSTLFHSRFAITKQWDWDFDRFDNVPGNQVALTRFRNKNGVSEIEGYLDTLDRINDKLFNEWWIGKIQAFRQRALKLKDTDDADADEEAEAEAELDDLDWDQIFTSAPDAMWKLPIGADIWESSTADLRQLLDSIKSELQWLASSTSNPLHTITPDAANGSAEGASLQREEHVYKIEDRRDRADGSWARTIAKAFLFQGDTERADVSQIETIWGPIERYSLQEKSNALAQVWGKLPSEIAFTDIMQLAPGDVLDRIRPARTQDLLLGIGAPPAAPAAPAPAPAPPVPDAPAS